MKLKKYLKNCNMVYHVTLDPKGPGVVRIHLVPPKRPEKRVSWVAVLNGYSLIPLKTAWGILLKEFIESVNELDNNEKGAFDYEEAINETAKNVIKLYPFTKKETIIKDIKDIIKVFEKVAAGEEIAEETGYMTLKKFGKHMIAPHRMDLMISAMEKNEKWNCNQKCLHCYACGEKKSNVKELSTEEWKMIIDRCKASLIPSLTFTGGEPTMREDLPELIGHAKWFVTRLNTNGIRLTENLCKELYDADLDSVQVTLYSSNPKIHNELVGGDHFEETIKGIKNAIKANLDVSINTPLCRTNKDYVELIKFGKELGVKYFSASGIIPSGKANDEDAMAIRLEKEEILEVIEKAFSYTKENELELSFTSPGWIEEAELEKMKMIVPSCGACLSNMAIAPDGEVIPCQSWLFEDGLGNMLTEEFKTIWTSKKCKMIRKKAMNSSNICPLKEVNR